MSNVNEYLRTTVKAISQKNVHVAPDIPEKKLNNAIVAFNYDGSPRSVVALFDNTLLGSGKDGLLFTGERVIYRASFSDPISINFTEIENVRNEKVESDISIIIERKSGPNVVIKNLLNCEYEKLEEIIKKASSEFEEHHEEFQHIPIELMSEKLKVAYVKVIIGMTFANDGEMDKKELVEVLLLITRLNFKPESRIEVRACMTSINDSIEINSLIKLIDSECPPGQQHNVHVSLTKDLISTHLSTGGKSLSDFEFLSQHKSLLSISQGEIEMAMLAIKNDREILNDSTDDEAIIVGLKMLAAKAAAVGTPVAAIYLSGSVIGLSAAGLTSGLAALGFGGILGLSGMVTGIGVIVLIGLGAYVGVNKLTGADEVSKSAKREMMLTQVIMQTQKTISLLIDDINFIIGQLNKAFEDIGSQSAQVRKLMEIVTAMAGAGRLLTEKNDMAERSVKKIHCAKFLDVNKLRLVTQEPTKIEAGNYILGFYEEREFSEEKDGQKSIIKKMEIKENISSNDLRTLSQAFELVGYFNASDVIAGTANDLKNKAKEKLSGFFS